MVGCASEKSIENLQNCQDLRLEMKEAEVLEIMGNPSSRREFYHSNLNDSLISIEYVYDNPLASSGIVIWVSKKNDSVIEINCSEE